MTELTAIPKEKYFCLYEMFCRSEHCKCVNKPAKDFNDCGTKLECYLTNFYEFVDFKIEFERRVEGK